MKHAGVDGVHSVGAEIRAGLKLGLGVTGGSTSIELENAEFLGAPGADGTHG
ncbi:hypothetical protein [Nocardiopsis suaedae]|uniref:Uncharacterized protein n=1 Tax=Nocardiopsis suaedae TaxID=3018444 RepID=A0ABT4TWF2_9ACTN|nr:hypothetical protein [Nocardiopsis suaedae]MDA2808550.1 hypothetical protein [Nocardiopsis suaedae]